MDGSRGRKPLLGMNGALTSGGGGRTFLSSARVRCSVKKRGQTRGKSAHHPSSFLPGLVRDTHRTHNSDHSQNQPSVLHTTHLRLFLAPHPAICGVCWKQHRHAVVDVAEVAAAVDVDVVAVAVVSAAGMFAADTAVAQRNVAYDSIDEPSPAVPLHQTATATRPCPRLSLPLPVPA